MRSWGTRERDDNEAGLHDDSGDGSEAWPNRTRGGLTTWSLRRRWRRSSMYCGGDKAVNPQTGAALLHHSSWILLLPPLQAGCCRILISRQPTFADCLSEAVSFLTGPVRAS